MNRFELEWHGFKLDVNLIEVVADRFRLDFDQGRFRIDSSIRLIDPSRREIDLGIRPIYHGR